ncbi:Thymocyte nuclear protein 1 [Lobosporangium transversale]|uniref:Thymocyte nuclear protein 1 n=1 Tax=Lobosporangium transversale TaxID=64571 RepID=A0A1Y2GXE5_9FUNG|nr:thymocyte nuclear protein 1-like protein [Lobosporangium transversale]KAF9916525.1 Thymocyte nuclear protein 1 [Lobosporangium transversale]ORZ26935.1 thymocyte nuclear protein 1-like protein [Lobosporangium transversale]|eukprot:XP_021884682.1 thymocyte nuclear protein 1-like protein [Lobosporangium transversale]
MQTRSKKREDASEQTSTSLEAAKPVKRTKHTKSTADKDLEPVKASTKPSKKNSAATKAVSDTACVNANGTRTSVWLMKSEPDTFSIDDLIKSENSTSHWDGVRNHEAKNLMKNSMKVGDRVLFYHSNTKEPGIVALARIAQEAYPDHTALDPKHEYYDEKSSKDDPRWFMVDVKFERKLKRILTLKELQQYKDKELCNMKLLNRGRLSVQPVSDDEMEFILRLEQKEMIEE